MKTSRYTEAQIIAILRQAEGGVPVGEVLDQLERLAGELACVRASDEEIEVLVELHERMMNFYGMPQHPPIRAQSMRNWAALCLVLSRFGAAPLIA